VGVRANVKQYGVALSRKQHTDSSDVLYVWFMTGDMFY
jgi:hypothetical protein